MPPQTDIGLKAVMPVEIDKESAKDEVDNLADTIQKRVEKSLPGPLGDIAGETIDTFGGGGGGGGGGGTTAPGGNDLVELAVERNELLAQIEETLDPEGLTATGGGGGGILPGGGGGLLTGASRYLPGLGALGLGGLLFPGLMAGGSMLAGGAMLPGMARDDVQPGLESLAFTAGAPFLAAGSVAAHGAGGLMNLLGGGGGGRGGLDIGGGIFNSLFGPTGGWISQALAGENPLENLGGEQKRAGPGPVNVEGDSTLIETLQNFQTQTPTWLQKMENFMLAQGVREASQLGGGRASNITSKQAEQIANEAAENPPKIYGEVKVENKLKLDGNLQKQLKNNSKEIERAVEDAMNNLVSNIGDVSR